MNQIVLALLTGLTTGGISCLAVQGGLLSSGVASQHEDTSVSQKSLSKTQYILLFLLAKIIGLSFLGFLLGSIGSVFQLSLALQAGVQIALGFFMFATVGHILHLHPLFRYTVITPPKFVFRFLRKYSKTDHDILTPIVLGFGTVLIPCGVTQLMMAAAVGSGNPLLGGAILGAYGIGTSPLFFTVGYATAKLLTHKALVYIPALLIAYFAITSINGGLTLLGSPYTLENFYQAIKVETNRVEPLGVAPRGADGKQLVTMHVTSQNYVPDYSAIKVGVPVQLTLNSINAQGCIRAFTIPSLNMTQILPETGTEIVEFTPTKTGKLTYSCNMGMYTGQFTVVF